VDAEGIVNWITNNKKIAEGSSIDLKKLPLSMNYKYVRAEITNGYGTVFTQPWCVAILPK
jgi:hypothetical protein